MEHLIHVNTYFDSHKVVRTIINPFPIDRVKYTELVHIIKEVGLDSRDVQIIANLYWNQTAYVTIAGNKTEETKIQRGVRQGCVCPFTDPIQHLL